MNWIGFIGWLGKNQWSTVLQQILWIFTFCILFIITESNHNSLDDTNKITTLYSPCNFPLNPTNHLLALAQPIKKEYVEKRNPEFECLFRIPCQPMTAEAIEKFTNNIKTFTKIYTAALFDRWFATKKDSCIKPRIMILVLVDGLMSDPRKLTTVHLHTDNRHLKHYINNIHFESTNMLLQGKPLVDVIVDLIDQLGYALIAFYNSDKKPHRHEPIPAWAWWVVGICASLAVLALLAEWLIVKKKISKKRPMGGGLPADTGRKTHLIF